MASPAPNRVHPTLNERAGPPSVVTPQDQTPERSSSRAPSPAPAAGTSSLPYPPSNPAPGQPSFPTPQKPNDATPATLQVPVGPQRPPSVPPPAYNTITPAAQPYGAGQAFPGYSVPAYYPMGVQPYGQQQQQQMQTTMFIAPAPPTHTYIATRRSTIEGEATGAIVLSCFVFWCCGCLFGLVAFILGIVACNTSDHPKKAHRLSVASYIVSGVGIGVMILALIIGLSVGLSSIGGSSSSSSSSSSSCSYTINGICYNSRSYSYYSTSCANAGGYYRYSDGYCYFTSSSSSYGSSSSCSYYYDYVSGTCNYYRSSSMSSKTCSYISGHYSSGYCYYDSSYCPYSSYGIQCYRYTSYSYSSSSCSSMGGYYVSGTGTCYY